MAPGAPGGAAAVAGPHKGRGAVHPLPPGLPGPHGALPRTAAVAARHRRRAASLLRGRSPGRGWRHLRLRGLRGAPRGRQRLHGRLALRSGPRPLGAAAGAGAPGRGARERAGWPPRVAGLPRMPRAAAGARRFAHARVPRRLAAPQRVLAKPGAPAGLPARGGGRPAPPERPGAGGHDLAAPLGPVAGGPHGQPGPGCLRRTARPPPAGWCGPRAALRHALGLRVAVPAGCGQRRDGQGAAVARRGLRGRGAPPGCGVLYSPAMGHLGTRRGEAHRHAP
mmetsp:Transcript_35733/g.113607  ORF Transcript_35733/g.113607 Transcript_35733/m.113607 type:complete len:280 (+) Transcript_35733:1073-1912(+)